MSYGIQVKIFGPYKNPADLEQKVNAWIVDSEVRVHSVNMEYHADMKSFAIMVTYWLEPED